MNDNDQRVESYLKELLLYKQRHEAGSEIGRRYYKAAEREAQLTELLSGIGFSETALQQRWVVAGKRYARWYAAEQLIRAKHVTSGKQWHLRYLLAGVLRLDPFNKALLEKILDLITPEHSDWNHFAKRYIMTIPPHDLQFERLCLTYGVNPETLDYDYFSEVVTAPLIEDLSSFPPSLEVPKALEGDSLEDLHEWGETATDLSAEEKAALQEQIEALKQRLRLQLREKESAKQSGTGNSSANTKSSSSAQRELVDASELERALKLRPFDQELLGYAMYYATFEADDLDLDLLEDYLSRYKTCLKEEATVNWEQAKQSDTMLGSFAQQLPSAFHETIEPLLYKYYPHPTLLFYQACKDVWRDGKEVLKPSPKPLGEKDVDFISMVLLVLGGVLLLFGIVNLADYSTNGSVASLESGTYTVLGGGLFFLLGGANVFLIRQRRKEIEVFQQKAATCLKALARKA